MDDKKTLKETIREELGKLSKLSWGQRFGYIWDYYKPLMVALLGIFTAISIGVTIYHNLQLEYLLRVYMLDSNVLELDPDALAADFGERIGGLGKNQVVTVDTSIMLADETSQYAMSGQVKLTTLAAAGDVDILILNPETYEKFAEMEYFDDLTQILTPQQQEEWADLLVPGENGGCYGLILTDSPVLNAYNAYMGDTVYGAVVTSGENKELCGEFFAYLLSDPQESGTQAQ